MDASRASAEQVLAEAERLGFDLVAIAPARPPRTVARYRAWLDAGYHGEMAYLARPDAVAHRSNPASILPGLQAMVALGANYRTRPLPPEQRDDPSRGVIAGYAWGDDYHEVMLQRLHQLAAFITTWTGEAAVYRAYVDTGPVLERDMAASAGLGFVGRNTNLIHPDLGSWFFLGELLLAADLGLESSICNRSYPVERGTCGQCSRCLEACPTGAFRAPYVLDAQRCISYLTIELKGPIPRDLRPAMGNRIFGCDVCQEVCPWNRRFARPTAEPAFKPRKASMAPKLLELIALDEQAFQQRFGASPLARTKRRGLLRNVAIALGNWGDRATIPALVRALHDVEPLIRGHAAWALGRISGQRVQDSLRDALEREEDGWVREEIWLGLESGSPA